LPARLPAPGPARQGPVPEHRRGRRGPAGADGGAARPGRQGRPQSRRLRRARRRPRQHPVFPQGGAGLRELLAVPGPDRAAGGGAGVAPEVDVCPLARRSGSASSPAPVTGTLKRVTPAVFGPCHEQPLVVSVTAPKRFPECRASSTCPQTPCGVRDSSVAPGSSPVLLRTLLLTCTPSFSRRAETGYLAFRLSGSRPVLPSGWLLPPFANSRL